MSVLDGLYSEMYLTLPMFSEKHQLLKPSFYYYEVIAGQLKDQLHKLISFTSSSHHYSEGVYIPTITEILHYQNFWLLYS